MIPLPVKEIAEKIGQFYLIKNNGDYKATSREIESLRISNIEINDNFLSINTGRPGMLIGRMGQNIDNLSNFLKETGLTIRIIEDMEHINDYLIPRDYE